MSKGEEIVITRYGHPVARLVAEEHSDDVRRAVEGLRELQQQIRRQSRAKLSDRHVRSDVDKGRL